VGPLEHANPRRAGNFTSGFASWTSRQDAVPRLGVVARYRIPVGEPSLVVPLHVPNRRTGRQAIGFGGLLLLAGAI